MDDSTHSVVMQIIDTKLLRDGRIGFSNVVFVGLTSLIIFCPFKKTNLKLEVSVFFLQYLPTVVQRMRCQRSRLSCEKSLLLSVETHERIKRSSGIPVVGFSICCGL